MNSVSGSKSPAVQYFNPADWGKVGSIITYYKCPTGELWCDSPIGRGALTGPGYKNVDLGVNKKFRITEGTSLTLMGNFFNLFNHANFRLPGANINSSTFGRSTATYEPMIRESPNSPSGSTSKTLRAS